MSTTTVINGLEAFLLRGRNTDGGWAYHPNRASRLEPTCWALLALGADQTDPTVLKKWSAEDGILLERPGGAPNFAFHAIALLAMRALGIDHERGAAPLFEALLRVKGEKLDPSDINRQDNGLQGWSWIPSTFSWVEPTAWSLLALKKLTAVSNQRVKSNRVDVAERLLVDRCCAGGGWNYGNSNMLGQELRAYVPTTAIALLAMQDRPTLPEIERSVDFLERNATTERSGTALSLALMSLTTLGRPVPGGLKDALIAQVSTTIDFGKHMGAAMSLYALREQRADAFTL